jgi:outer membrane protein insertion porin family
MKKQFRKISVFNLFFISLLFTNSLSLLSVKSEETAKSLSNPLDEIADQEITDQEASDPNQSIGNFDKPITIQQIQVSGNQLVPTEVILNSLKTKKGTKFSRRKISYDLQALNNLGYFDKDKLLAIPIPQGEEGILLKIQVVENRPITGLIIKGNDLMKKAELEQFLTPLIGMPRSSNQIRKAVEKIEKIYHDKGFILAAVNELHFDPDGFLTINIDEGKIEAIEFEGNTRTKTSYLDRLVPEYMKDGKAYNEENIIKFMEGLQKTGYFKDVKREIKPSPTNPDKHIVTFKMEEQRTKALSVGTGIGSFNGIFGNVSFTEPNFRGQGENLSLSAQAGTGLLTAIDGDTDGRFVRRPNYTFGANYSDPFVGNSNVALGLNSSAQQFGSWIVDSALQRTLRGGFTTSQPLKWGMEKHDGQKRWALQNGLTVSSNEVINFGSNARDTLTTEIMKEGKSLADATNEAKDLRNKQLKDGFYLDTAPTLVYRNFDDYGSGWRNTFFGGPSIGLGGAGSYGSLGVDIRRYQRLTEDGWYFKNNFHAEGLMGDVAGFRNLKMGGPYGMRGYRQFRDIGIGTNMITNTAEFSIPLVISKNPIKDTKLVFFNDFGLVAGQSRLNDLYGRKSFASSFGVGLDLTIPMLGPMRIDYGIPLIRADNKSFWSGRVHINAGSQL